MQSHSIERTIFFCQFDVEGLEPSDFLDDLPRDRTKSYVTEVGARKYAERTLRKKLKNGDIRRWFAIIIRMTVTVDSTGHYEWETHQVDVVLPEDIK